MTLRLSQSPAGAYSPPKFTTAVHPLFSDRRPNFANPSTSSRNHDCRKPCLSVNANAGGIGSGAKTKATAAYNNSEEEEEEAVSFVGLPLEGVIQLGKPPQFPSRIHKWGKVALLAGGDVLALLIFSVIGRFSHGFSVFDTETLRTADPFIAGCVLSAYFLGGYGEDGRGLNGQTSALTAAVKSWALGIPLGIAIMSTNIGHFPPINFILPTMASTAVLLIGWRAFLSNILPGYNSKKNDVYKRVNLFELLELLTSLVRRW